MVTPAARRNGIRFEMAQIPVPVLATDADATIVQVNDPLCQLLGTSRRSLLGAPLDSVLNGRMERVDECTTRHVVYDDDGQRRWLHCVVSRQSDPDLGPLEIRWLTEISEFESRRRGRSAVLSGLEATRVEPDTGVLNRRAVLQELQSEISRSRRYGNPLSALLARMTMREPPVEPGAETDAICRGLEHLHHSLRWVDSVGRVSAKEFLVLLPETNAAGADRVAVKISREVGTSEDLAPLLALELRSAAWKDRESAEDFLARLKQQSPGGVG